LSAKEELTEVDLEDEEEEEEYESKQDRSHTETDAEALKLRLGVSAAALVTAMASIRQFRQFYEVSGNTIKPSDVANICRP
jgi:hypothetical protein